MKQKTNNNLFIAITGDIGSGKSTVIDFFIKKKITIWKADKVVHELYSQEEVLLKIKKMFGDIVIKDNMIDKGYIKKIVFKDPSLLKKLNNYMIPLIDIKLKSFIDEVTFKNKNEIVIFEIPLLFENNLEIYFDLTVLIEANKSNKIIRVMQRDKCTKKLVASILENQMPQEVKKQKANIIISNNGNIKTLYLQLDVLLQTFISISKANC